MPEAEDLDFAPALDAYVEKIEEFAKERGDRVTFKDEGNGAQFMGILTKNGIGISLTINYTP